MHGTLPQATRPAWFPDWSGDVAAIVAGGSSVTQDQVDHLRGRCRVVVINNSYKLAPWADALYAADEKWWVYHKDAKDFAGLKVTPDVPCARRLGLNLVKLHGEADCDSDRVETATPGTLYRGGNSGFQAVNLVTQFGAKRQLWLGFDFHGEHWHGKHPEPLANPRAAKLETWRKRLDVQFALLIDLGVEVINASPISKLMNYRKMSIDDAFAHWGI